MYVEEVSPIAMAVKVLSRVIVRTDDDYHQALTRVEEQEEELKKLRTLISHQTEEIDELQKEVEKRDNRIQEILMVAENSNGS